MSVHDDLAVERPAAVTRRLGDYVADPICWALVFVAVFNEYSESDWGVRSGADLATAFNSFLVYSPVWLSLFEVCALVLIWLAIRRGDLRLGRVPSGLWVILSVIAIIGTALLSAARIGHNPDVEAFHVLREARPLLAGVLVGVIGWSARRDTARVGRVLDVWLVAAVCKSGAGMIRRLLLGDGRFYYGSTFVWYDYADSVLLVGGITIAAWRLMRPGQSRTVLSLAMLVQLYAFVFSFRRSLWVGAAVAVTALLFTRRGTRFVPAFTFLSLTAIVFLLSFRVDQLSLVTDRIGSILDFDDDPSNRFRSYDTANAVDAIVSDFGFGAGFGTRTDAVNIDPTQIEFIEHSSRAVHNGFLYLVFKVGLLLTVWLLVPVAISLTRSWRYLRQSRAVERRRSPVDCLAYVAFTVLAASAVASLALPFPYNVRPMVLVGIIAGMSLSALSSNSAAVGHPDPRGP